MKGLYSTVFIFLFLIAWATNSFAQSFDCSKASSADERAICGSPELSWLDTRLNRLYAIAVKKLNRPNLQNLANQQRIWLVSRKRCGGDFLCLIKRYETRIDDLEYLPVAGIFVPSFVCGSRLSADEQTICDTPSLARLDAQLSRQFVKTKQVLSPDQYAALLSSQGDWLRARRNCYDDRACIKQHYQSRIKVLKQNNFRGQSADSTQVVKRKKEIKPSASQSAPALPITEKRQALIIGNSSYKHAATLKNPQNDAELIAASLRKTGFTVTLLINASQSEMKRAMRNFGRTLRASNAIGLFYYAGHGVQVKGENYLIPIDANIVDETEVEIESINVNAFLQTMESARSRMNIIILDACRSNPFGSTSRGSAQGLAPVRAPNGTFIGYATSPGDVARDGEGQNSPYAKAIASNLLRPNLSIEQVFKKVRIEVQQETESQQMPWDLSSLTGDFYFLRR